MLLSNKVVIMYMFFVFKIFFNHVKNSRKSADWETNQVQNLTGGKKWHNFVKWDNTDENMLNKEISVKRFKQGAKTGIYSKKNYIRTQE